MNNIKTAGVFFMLIFLEIIICKAQDIENIMVRIVYVTPDWMPYSTEDAFLRSTPVKETKSLKFYDVAIWEENKSIQLYSVPNNYFDNRPPNGSPEVESYRESFAIGRIDGLPDGFGSIERSEFLRNALKTFVTKLVKLHPKAAHHFEYNGHGAPGGQLFSGFLLPQHVTEFLSFWIQELGHKLGVIDFGGPCDMGDFSTLETVNNYADYYIASDLTNGGYQMDNWTFEKYGETDPDYQYHRIFRDYPILLDGLKERINLKRKNYEYSRENMIRNKVQQANYLYSCQNFKAFSTAFKAYMLIKNRGLFNSSYPADPNYNIYGDLYGFLLNQNNDSLIALFNDIILYKVNNRDFFEWKGFFNGLICPVKYGNLTLNMVPPFVKLPSVIIAQENKYLPIEVTAYDIEQDRLVYSWKQLSGPQVSIENETTAKISFTVPKFDKNNILKLSVMVDDGKYSVSDTISVLCPIANAGADQIVNEGVKVTLDGTASSDPVGNPLTYKWSAPSSVSLSSATAAKPTFTAPDVSAETNYSFSLVVNDGIADSPADQVIITIKALPDDAGTITGAKSVCQGQNSVSYSVPSISNATSYTWSLPAGATGTSTTNTISVNYGTSAVSGSLTVKGHNDCGDGATSTLAVTVNPKPATPVVTVNGNILHSNTSNGNQWYKSSSLISGATSQDYAFSVIGDYSVVVTLNSCTSDPSVISVVTGLDPLDYGKKIIVYPNPVTNELIIEFEGNTEKTDFVILGTTGQVVYTGYLYEKVALPTTGYAPGLYFIKLRSGRIIEFKKIVKL